MKGMLLLTQGHFGSQIGIGGGGLTGAGSVSQSDQDLRFGCYVHRISLLSMCLTQQAELAAAHCKLHAGLSKPPAYHFEAYFILSKIGLGKCV